MDEQVLVDGYQVEGYYRRRNTKLKKGRKAFLHKFWRDWLIEQSLFDCQNKYIALNKKFLQIGETTEDLRQEAFEDVLLTTFRFNPSKIKYVPIKRKRTKAIFANLNEPIYHSKRFIQFTKEVLKKDVKFRELKAKYPKYDLYLEGVKEWLIRQFMTAFSRYVVQSVNTNYLKQNTVRNKIHSHENIITVIDFKKAEVMPEDDIGDNRLKFVRANMSEELTEFMVDKLYHKNTPHFLRTKYGSRYRYLLGESRKYEEILLKDFSS